MSDTNNVDYYALDRPKVFLPLDRLAVQTRFPDSEPRFGGDWHPHVELDPRPTHGARQWILDKMRAHNEAVKTVMVRERAKVAALRADATDEQKKKILEVAAAGIIKNEMQDTLDASNWAKWLESEALMQTFLDADVKLESSKINAVKVATYVRSLGGDWGCYANAWEFDGEAPEWPALSSDPESLRKRLALVFRLADADIKEIVKAIEPTTELSKGEVGKSEAPPVSPSPPASPTLSESNE